MSDKDSFTPCFNSIGDYNKILSRCTSLINPLDLGSIQIEPNTFHFTYNSNPYRSKFHQHKFYEVSFMLSGEMDYDLKTAKCHLSTFENNIIMIPAGVVHDRITSSVPALIGGFMLDIIPLNHDGQKLLPAMKHLLTQANFRFSMPAASLNFSKLILEELTLRRPFFHTKIKLLLRNFIFELFREALGELLWVKEDAIYKKIAYEQDTLVYMVKTYIEENLSLPFSVQDIAEHFYLCKRHLNRIFTDQTGIPLGHYIADRKIKSAKQQLFELDATVNQVAYSLGFKDVSYFCRFFKKHVGITPAEYRKQPNYLT